MEQPRVADGSADRSVGNLTVMPLTSTADRQSAVSSTAAALAHSIAQAQGGDPLAPVDVVVPNGPAGVTLRRAAAGTKGLANVRFSTLPQLAERLSARHIALTPGPLRRPLVGDDRATAVQAALAGAPSSRLVDAARAQRATAGLLEGVFAELDAARIDPADRPQGLSKVGIEVLELYAAYRARVPDLLSRADLLAQAIEALAAGAAPTTHVILVAYGIHSAPERALFDALHAAQRLSVVPGPYLPPATVEYLASLGVADVPSVPSPTVDRLVVAPDAEEEVRLVIRAVLDRLSTTACRPERIGVAFTAPVPYARLLAEQLGVARIPHHVAGRRTLAQTVTGRTLRSALDLHARAFPRADVLRWLADAPILDASGASVPVTRWERISRDAGISRGLETWRSRLTRYAEDQRLRAEDVAPDDKDREARYRDRADAAEALLVMVEQLSAALDAVTAATTWVQAGDALQALLTRVLGEPPKVTGWAARTDRDLAPQVAIEQQAHDAILAGLADLQRLDATGRPYTAAAVVPAVDDLLDVGVRSGTTLGRGVLVGPIRDFAGADLDALFVLGATESALPARQREHAILRDADRALLSPELPTVASRRVEGRRLWDCALAGAGTVQLSYPRADTRAQRRQFASPWFLEHATRLAGKTVSADDVDKAKLDGPWFTSHASFDSSLRHAETFASLHELDAAIAQRGHVDVLSADDPRLARGLAAARSRAAGIFDEWTGHTGPLPDDLRARVDRQLSATNLQMWATCPTSHLYAKVLGIRPLEDRGAADTIDARDKGSLVHTVLEQMIGAHLPTADRQPMPADRAWSPAELAQAAQLLDDEAAALQARGLTGRDVLWTAQLSALHRALVRALSADNKQRWSRMSHPVAVECDFGRNGVDPLVINLPTQGEVEFAGSIDRVDARVGGGLVVIDYKTGGTSRYKKIPDHTNVKDDANLIDRGRKLQLVLYALAARQLYGDATTPVEAWFWFVESGDLRGGRVTAVQEEQLRSALDVAVDGIRGGVYPVNPGADDWRPTGATWEACLYCPFDLVCPTGRAEQWAHVRTDPVVRPYAELVDPPAVTP